MDLLEWMKKFYEEFPGFIIHTNLLGLIENETVSISIPCLGDMYFLVPFRERVDNFIGLTYIIYKEKLRIEIDTLTRQRTQMEDIRLSLPENSNK